METNEDIIDILNSIHEFKQLHDLVQDDELDTALAAVVQLISKPDVSAGEVPRAIVKLQALSAKFAFAATYYKTFGKSGANERYKKDVYYTARDAIDKLVDALKYVVRAQQRGF